MNPAQCPLCEGTDIPLWFEDARRQYRRCERCELVFVPQQFQLDADAEKAVYDLHQNALDDLGYHQFLQRVISPLQARINESSCGLDFGCGPGPLLAQLLRQAGHQVALFDKYYFPDTTVLQQRYDFITATEVVEHLAHPREVWQTLFSLLKSDGWLAIMTKRVRDRAAFSRWHYIQDPTHIAFYSDHTFAWIAQHWGYDFEIVGADVVLLHKHDNVGR